MLQHTRETNTWSAGKRSRYFVVYMNSRLY
jgi:hypothetical protein